MKHIQDFGGETVRIEITLRSRDGGNIKVMLTEVGLEGMVWDRDKSWALVIKIMNTIRTGDQRSTQRLHVTTAALILRHGLVHH